MKNLSHYNTISTIVQTGILYKKVKLLILDEWLLYPLKDTEARDLLEITESRYKKASTIFCSQFDVGGWHTKKLVSPPWPTPSATVLCMIPTPSSSRATPCANTKV
jgi:hypothetical protein